MKSYVIIPARMEAVRYPGKPLALLNGRTVIEHVWTAASKAKLADQVIIATNSPDIYDAGRAFGATVTLTSSRPRTGSERVAEVAANLEPDSVIINLQGDEPLMRPATIDAVIAPIAKGEVELSTAAAICRDRDAFRSASVVKVVIRENGDALYFSRASIPAMHGGNFLRHIGIYGFKREALLKLAAAPRTRLEEIEDLEQLRALELGYQIRVVQTSYSTVAIDTPEDLARAARYFPGK